MGNGESRFLELKGERGYVPIAFIAIHNAVLARVGQQEDDCRILLYSSGTRAIEIEVIKKPRERSVIVACASL